MPATVVKMQNHRHFFIGVIMVWVVLCSVDILIHKIICRCTII